MESDEEQETQRQNHRACWARSQHKGLGSEYSRACETCTGFIWPEWPRPPAAHQSYTVVIGFGETWGVAESANTDQMLTVEGRLEMAQWAQKQLKLRQIRPEWLTADSENQDAK